MQTNNRLRFAAAWGIGWACMLAANAAYAGQAVTASTCLSYEPSVVKLTGTLFRQQFPGPPNYEDVRKGDRPATSLLIKLSKPVCVNEDKNDPLINVANKDVRIVQLVLSLGFYKSHKALLGKRVVATGTLFGEHTGHHHTPGLLIVSSLSKDDDR